MKFDWTTWKKTKKKTTKKFIMGKRDYTNFKFEYVPQPKLVIFFIRVTSVGHKYKQCVYIVQLPWDKLHYDFVRHPRECDYVLHNRLNDVELDYYLTPLGTEDYPFSHAVVVQDQVYGVFNKGVIMCLSWDSREPWQSVTKPNAQHRWFPTLISLGGMLYMIGGFPVDTNHNLDFENLPFGEVYNPKSKEWTPLKPPPDSALLCFCDTLFITSLGESEGNILIFFHKNMTMYMYDVSSCLWVTCSWEFLQSYGLSGILSNKDVSGSVIVNPENKILYWVDRRSSFIYALDWQYEKLYSGPIIGMEDILDPSKGLDDPGTTFSLIHVNGDWFCLIWSSTHDDTFDGIKSELHFTELKVQINPSIDILEARIVGCSYIPILTHFNLFDACPLWLGW